MRLRTPLLLLAAVLLLGVPAAIAQGIDNDSKLSAGASGSDAGMISGGGKVYSNLEAVETGARPKEAIPETRKVSKKYAGADTGESRRTKAKKKQKTADKEVRSSKQVRSKKEARYNSEVRYVRRSGFNAFIVPDYPRY